MNDFDLFSSNTYLYLPTKNNPKVAICVDNTKLTSNAFKLYNPFSLKAKILKYICLFCFTYFNKVLMSLCSLQEKNKSEFIKYLETKLDCSIVVSLYFATINDKVVIQLQTTEADIIGYLKYPLNNIGLKHLDNEINAISILSNKGIVEPEILIDEFENKPFLLLKPLEGNIKIIERKNVDILLQQFNRNKCFYLSSHPRVQQLENSLLKNNLSNLLPLLKDICNQSTYKFSLVYEHGDFAPWNIVQVDNNFIPFDFEYFVEDGLEFFDLIKYYYQIGTLLKKKQNQGLLTFIQQNIEFPEIILVLQLYLIKEVIRGEEENEPYNTELDFLNYLRSV